MGILYATFLGSGMHGHSFINKVTKVTFTHVFTAP